MKKFKVEILPPANWVGMAAPVQQHPGGFFSHFQIYCGNHGTNGGKLGDKSHDEFFRDIENGITLLKGKLEKSKIHTFKFDIQQIP